jgi:hypothetical protein
MAEIEQLTPAYRVPPSRPAAGSGQGKEAPQRKPRDDDRQHEQQRQRKRDDDASRIDEYV